MNDEQFKIIYEYTMQLRQELTKIILGKEEFITLLLVGFFSGGHILIEDVPGLGKTTSAKALVNLIRNAQSSRIQCTPDLLPYDITGVEFYDAEKKSFVFEKGPIFADIVLADELNRASPRTQSALLEAMAESQVTVSNKTHALSEIFFVIATQNPIDREASYQLPIAELDRFLFKLSMGYPSLEHEKLLLAISNKKNYLNEMKPILDASVVMEIKASINHIYCDEKMLTFIAHLAQACRNHPEIALGPSPRASMQLIQAAKTLALLSNRSFIIDEDIKLILPAAWIHRMQATDEHVDLRKIILDIYEKEWTRVFLKR